MGALNTIEMTSEEQNSLLEIVGSVLHLGNVTFGEDELAKSVVYENEHIHALSKVTFYQFLINFKTYFQKRYFSAFDI